MSDCDSALSTHPNPRAYWLILRIMAITAGVLFIVLGLVGMGIPLPWVGAIELTDAQQAARSETQEVLGWVVILYAGLSQTCEGIKAWKASS